LQHPRARCRFQPIRDVHAVAVYVLFLDDDVAEIDTDAEIEPLVWRRKGIPLVLPGPSERSSPITGTSHGFELTTLGLITQHSIPYSGT